MGSTRVELNTEIARQMAAEMAARRLATKNEGIPSPSVSAAPVRNPGTGSGDPINIQNFKVNLEEIIKRNGESSKTVDSQKVAAEGTAFVPSQINTSQEQLAKVGASDAIKFKSASKLETTDALKSINSLAASMAYGKNATATKSTSEFQPLKNAHVSEPSVFAATSTLSQNNAANYTSGLSFANINNLNNLKFMEIA